MRCIFSLLILSSTLFAQDLKEIAIPRKDGTTQPAFIYELPEAPESAVPLLVLLHTWSGDYKQQSFIGACQKECEQRGWYLIHPNFRGPNKRPEACGSELAQSDILAAVSWMIEHHKIDLDRVYLMGTSGGGHMSLLMAGRYPNRWAGVSAWVGISDLAAWHQQTKAAGRKYYLDLEKSCGGAPGTSTEVDEQYRLRSPITWLADAKDLPLDINVGIHDGHTGSVPVSQSLHAFNILAKANGQPEKAFSPELIESMTQSRQVPDELLTPIEENRVKPVLHRRSAGPARITIFDGGHEGEVPIAIEWLAHQKKSH